MFASRPRTAAEKLRSKAEAKAHDMAAHNPTRIHLVEKLEKLVEEYNLGTPGVEAFFEALKALVATMEDEERRAAREGLSEDELAVFDLPSDLPNVEAWRNKIKDARLKRNEADYEPFLSSDPTFSSLSGCAPSI
jgi:type I restriction enzyme R subunit